MSGYTAAQALVDYRGMLNDQGETITLRRLPSTDVEVMACRINDVRLQETVGVRQSSQRRFLVLADDLEEAGFPLPFQANKDRMIWAGRTLVITEADDTTRRTNGALIAYELATAGA